MGVGGVKRFLCDGVRVLRGFGVKVHSSQYLVQVLFTFTKKYAKNF